MKQFLYVFYITSGHFRKKHNFRYPFQKKFENSKWNDLGLLDCLVCRLIISQTFSDDRYGSGHRREISLEANAFMFLLWLVFKQFDANRFLIGRHLSLKVLFWKPVKLLRFQLQDMERSNSLMGQNKWSVCIWAQQSHGIILNVAAMIRWEQILIDG